MKLLIFFGGVLVGSLLGMITLCLVQINRESEEELRRIEAKHNAKE